MNRSHFAAKAESFLHQITPDPFILAIALTAVSFVSAKLVGDVSTADLIHFWSQGFWSLTTFTLQMLMVLVTGFILASSPLLQKGLKKIVNLPKTETSAILLITIVSTVTYLLNWGLGLIVGSFLALEMARRQPQLNFRILVASSYTGFVIWHGGFSASIPLLLNTSGNFSEKWAGRIIPLSETLFSPVNIACVGVTLIFLPFFNVVASKLFRNSPISKKIPAEIQEPEIDSTAETWADHFELSPGLIRGVGIFLLLALIVEASAGKWALDLNRVITLLLAFGFLLHPNLRAYSKTAGTAMAKGSGILIQYPFYGGIMGVMTNTNLTQWIAEKFVSVSTPETFGMFTLWSAALVNFLVPSGGGQWAVQGPIALEAAKALGVDYGFTAMAVAWGGTLTDLAQPFWALPVLAMVGLKARDIIGPCLVTLVAMTGIVSVIFYIFAK